MEFVRASRMLYAQTRVFAADVSPLLCDLGGALLDVLLIGARLVVALARPLLALALALRRALAPTFSAAVAAAWAVFVAQSPEALALEAALGGAVVLLLALEARYGVLRGLWAMWAGGLRAMGRWYGGVRRGVRQKSRVAAAALSHVVFVLPCVFGAAWFGGWFQDLMRTWGVFVAGSVAPVWKTAGALYLMEEDAMEEDAMEEDVTPIRSSRRAAELAGVGGVDANGIAIEEVSDEDSDDPSAEAEALGPVEAKNESLEPGVEPTDDGPDTPSMAVGLRRRRPSAARSETPSSTTSPRSVVATPEPVTPQRSRRSAARSARRNSKTNEMELLRYWSVFGILWAGRALAHYFVPAVFSSLLLRFDLLLFYVLVWLQLSLTRGADLLFPVLASSLRQGHHLRSNASAGAEQLNVFLRVLVSVGAVPAERAAMITSNLTESGVVLLGIIFFVTPRAATYVGTLLTGYIVPVYFTVFAATPASPPVTRHTWLSYWATFAVIEAVHMHLSKTLDWVPLWYHAKLALILWLQVPYYRGASALLDSGMGYFGSFVSACRRTSVTPRKLRVD